MKSWRTTLSGVMSIVISLWGCVASPLLDENPATKPQWEVAFAAVTAGIGLISARDNKVSSEQAGVKPPGAA